MDEDDEDAEMDGLVREDQDSEFEEEAAKKKTATRRGLKKLPKEG